ncbi:paraquat-inducible protein A [Raoultella sp. BIGb0399]|uniref:paraquat-inducible protein A n=1 Tax=Raoultella sp. BIGb0399 TaxID=2485119 RepID=UPI000F4C778B|nr:paraquat-inducible protein A [Raoultella sp. BIGb0399]ROS15031.1 paraquat-inducible protein A [Raoultella sp. BIGb0399]
MKTFPHLTICPHCDSVYQTLPCVSGEIALCQRCHAVLWRGHRRVPGHLLPLMITAAVALAIAALFPVLSVGFHGMVNDATLWNVAWALTAGDSSPAMAIGSVFLLLIAPFLQVMLMAWLLSFAHFARPAPAFISTMRVLKWLHPWSMVEVGMLGFLIAGIKLSSLLDVSIGPGGWALALSCVLVVFINSHDLHPLLDLLSYEEQNHDQ